MKILHLISQRPESTGSGFYVQNIIRLARRAGHENYLIAGVPAGNLPRLDCIDGAFCSYVTFSGGDLEFPVPGMSDVMPYESSLFSRLSMAELNHYEEIFAARIGDVVSNFSPDIIHSHHLWIASSVARRTVYQVPLVTSCHSTDLRQFLFCPHLRQRVLSGCQKIDRVLALSNDQSNKIQDLYALDEHRIDVVGAGFDEGLFGWHKKAEPSTVQMLYAGKLSFSKGVDWLLRCMAKLENVPLHLHLAGSGSGIEEETCLKLAAALKSKVTIHGRISQAELSSLMQQCHIFILPSFYEGLPLVLLEAIASGCRIVTTTLPGCRELLGYGNCDFVEFIQLPDMEEVDRPNPADQEVLNTRLLQALDSMVQRVLRTPSLDKNEVQKIVRPYGWSEVFKRIEGSYQQALRDRGNV